MIEKKINFVGRKFGNMCKLVWGAYFIFLSLPLFAAGNVKDSLALLLAKADTDTAKIAILQQIASSYDEYGMEVSLEYAQELVSLIDKQPQNRSTATNYANAAIIFLNCNVYDKSLELLLKALKIFEQAEDLRAITVLKNTMGGVYLRLGRMEQALVYFKEGLANAQQLISQGDTTYKSLLYVFYNNIGLIYNESEDKNVLAGSYFEKALELIEPDDYNNLAQCYNNMANYYSRQNQDERAFQCATESMRYRKLANDELGIARTSCTLASLYSKKKEYGKAKKYLYDAEEIGVRINSNLMLENIYRLRIEIAEEEKDYYTATQYLRKQAENQQLLLNDRILEKTTALQMEYNFEKKLSLHKLEMERERNRSKLMLLTALMLLIVGILFYLLVLNHNKRIKAEKKALVADLESKNKELTTNVMYLMKNTELVKDIITRLVALRPNMKAENARIVKDIITDLEASMKDDSWNEFEAHFNNVHLDFYKKLKERCPDLTPAELKMCAFLRLNMSSKEIASMSGITVKSVDVMRGRIRKKLNIANTDVNLINFLSDF